MQTTVVTGDSDLMTAAVACRAARRAGQTAVLWDTVTNKAISLRALGL